MALVDYEKRLAKAEWLLDKVAIGEVNKDLIRRFVEFKAAGKVTVARQIKYLTILRLIVQKFSLKDKDFDALTKDDVIKLVAQIERSNLSAWSKYDYEVILKTFFRFLGKEAVISWLKVTHPRQLPDDLITEREVQELIESAFSLRDKAFIAMLYEGGFRIGEFGGLRVKDISFDQYGAIAMVTGKTGPRRVRLIWSMPYIAQWLEAHPKQEDRKAPLWTKLDGTSGALDYAAIRVQLQKIAKRAGIEKKVNPHNFRHSRSTHLASKLTESQMEEYLGWVQGSKMPSVYVRK